MTLLEVQDLRKIQYWRSNHMCVCACIILQYHSLEATSKPHITPSDSIPEAIYKQKKQQARIDVLVHTLYGMLWL